MSQSMSITKVVPVNVDSSEAAHGYELAEEAWLSLSRGVDINAAAHALAESLLGIVSQESNSVAAETLVGVVSLFLEVASKPKSVEVGG